MAGKDFNWESFFDVATTTDAAKALDALYGEGAARAAIECALEAHMDDRIKDRRYWIAVFGKLRRTLH